MPAVREVADLYGTFAEVAKALASPHRLAILEVLSQGPRPVEEIVTEVHQPFANVSQHLQSLKRAGLVVSRREGQRVVYSLSGDDVVLLCSALKDVAERHVAEAERAVRTIARGREALEAITIEDLRDRLAQGDVTVVDVRSRRDYEAGHIPGALNIPYEELESRLHELPAGAHVVAYCRGPYCVCADEAVRAMLRENIPAARLTVGLPQWRAVGMPIEK